MKKETRLRMRSNVGERLFRESEDNIFCVDPDFDPEEEITVEDILKAERDDGEWIKFAYVMV